MPDGKRHCAIAPTTEELIATVVPPSSFARAIDLFIAQRKASVRGILFYLPSGDILGEGKCKN